MGIRNSLVAFLKGPFYRTSLSCLKTEAGNGIPSLSLVYEDFMKLESVQFKVENSSNAVFGIHN